MHRTKSRRAAFAAALLAGSALSGAALQAWAQAPAAANAPIEASRAAPAALPGFADLAARVGPAVVTITTTQRVQVADDGDGAPGLPQGLPPGLKEFFGRQGPFGGRDGGRSGGWADRGAERGDGRGDGRGDSRGPVAHALGSGFLVDAAGHVVTNNHVVRGAQEIQVTLADGRELPARVVGRDARTDLAVLKVDAGADALPFLQLGDSDTPRVGDWVVAIGNPFGLGGTVTAGILSARGRTIGEGPYDDFLQVDAPINRGNSGGPLFAQDGTVIGVNTAIFSPSGGSVGIGFAIPSNLVKRVVAQLEANGRVERGFLGAATQAVTPALAAALRLEKPEGALVAEVARGGPAARAGLRAGDVVTAVDTSPVRTPRDLARLAAELRPGTDAVLHVRRDGAEQDLRVKVAAQPDRDGQEGKKPAQG